MAELRDVAPGLWIWRLEVSRLAARRGGGNVSSRRPAPHREASSRSAIRWRGPRTRPRSGLASTRSRRRPWSCAATARAFGPWLFWPRNVPATELEPIEAGSELPGGLVALYDGRGRNETPLWPPEQRALVFADALNAPGGELRVWASPWHHERALPALLELPFELVIVSHGEPVHGRAEYERALGREPWEG